MDFNKNFIERNEAEPKNWKRPFDSEVFNVFFRIISIIFNSITSKYLNILFIFILVPLIFFKQWIPFLILAPVYLFIRVIRYWVNWFLKNYKDMKTATTSENVTFIKFEKDKNIDNDINLNQSSLPFK